VFQKSIRKIKMQNKRELKIEEIEIRDINPYDKNAKKHPRNQIDLLVQNIQRFGFTTPCLVDAENNLIAGHGRLEAVKLLEWEKVPCVKIEDLNEEEIKALRLADNKIAEMGEWDMGLVLDELKELSEDTLHLTGFSEDLLIDDDSKDDEVPNTPEESKSKLGDLYELGAHRVLCGDSTAVEAVSALMGASKADMVLTDPPYNVNYEGGTGLKIENDNMGDTAFLEFLTEAFKRMAESIKLGGAFYIWHADSEGFNFRKATKDAGFLIKQCIIWNKNSLVMGMQDYQWKHEPCLYGWREGASHTWYGDRNKTTVLKVPEDDAKAFEWFKKQLKRQESFNTSIVDHSKPNKNKEHPTMKPVELLQKQIVNSSKQKDIVLDLFLGSGSTLIASEKTGRICYGMELDPRYIDVIIQRWVDYTGIEKIIKNGEEIIWKKTIKITNQ
jgi:DNA modification methylase